jgi:hypothetical protein
LKFYRCYWVQNEPRLLGCADLRWVSAEELKDYEFPAADARLLERLKQDRTLWSGE